MALWEAGGGMGHIKTPGVTLLAHASCVCVGVRAIKWAFHISYTPHPEAPVHHRRVRRWRWFFFVISTAAAPPPAVGLNNQMRQPLIIRKDWIFTPRGEQSVSQSVCEYYSSVELVFNNVREMLLPLLARSTVINFDLRDFIALFNFE